MLRTFLTSTALSAIQTLATGGTGIATMAVVETTTDPSPGDIESKILQAVVAVATVLIMLFRRKKPSK